MCLKFLLESNPENQKLVSTLEAREVVPGPSGGDALGRMGVDVSLGEDGKVKVTSNGSSSQAKHMRNQERESGASSRDKALRKAALEDEARRKLENLDLDDTAARDTLQNHGDVEFM